MGWQLIQSYNVGDSITAAPAASVTFSSIPQTYKTLVLMVSARQDLTGPNSLGLKVNGATSNYSSRWLRGNGSAAASGGDTLSPLVVGFDPLRSATSNTFANVEIRLPNYASTTANKPMNSDSVGENNATAADQSLVANLWSSTSAITSIEVLVYSGGGVFTFGSTFTLYGLI